MSRRYELKQRAEGLQATRARIVEATVQLHDAIGPVRTTVTAIADLAGVQRLTIYRHFPDERSLYEACSAHWAAQNPLPDQAEWMVIADPEARLRTALREIYAFYSATEGMTGNLLRDIRHDAVVQEVAAPFVRYWQAANDTLCRGWAVRDARRRLLRAAVGHAVEFETWRSLTRTQGLAREKAAELMVKLVRAAAAPPTR